MRQIALPTCAENAVGKLEIAAFVPTRRGDTSRKMTAKTG
jgi:hypothetical protein